MGQIAEELRNQHEHLDEALNSTEFNVTRGLQRKYLEKNEAYSNEFKESGALLLPEFLENWLADNIYGFLTVDAPSTWWAYTSGETDESGFSLTKEVNQIFAENKGERDAMHAQAFNAYKKNKYSYAYAKQIGNHPTLWSNHAEGCGCFICNSLNTGIFKPGGEFEAAVSNVLGSKYKINTLEWSRFNSNDFYGPREVKQGMVGFSLYLTKNWSPLWGGNLVFIDDKEYISETVPSQYNSLCLFKAGTTAITPVIPNFQKSCYCLMGVLESVEDLQS